MEIRSCHGPAGNHTRPTANARRAAATVPAAVGRRRARAGQKPAGTVKRTACTPDAREHDQLYQHFHDRLTEDFAPVDFTEEAAVAELATLYVQATRVNQLIEAAQQPEVNDKDASKWEKLQQLRAELALVDDVILRCRNSEPFYYAPSDAERMAQVIGDITRHIFDQLAEGEDALSHEEMDEQEIQELQHFQQLGRLLRPAKRRMQDQAQLQQLFTGDRPSKRGELRKIRCVLEQHQEGLRIKIADRADAERKAEAAIAQKTVELARDPDELHRLLDLKERIDRSIQRVLKRLPKG
jgi:hypothetical protein